MDLSMRNSDQWERNLATRNWGEELWRMEKSKEDKEEIEER